MRRPLPMLISATLCLVAFAGCKNDEPVGEYFTTIEYFVDGDEKSRFVAEVAGATERVDIAFTRLVDDEVADAIVQAKENGATVRVVADLDYADDPGMETLDDAGIDVTFGDGALAYLPEPNLASLVDDCGFVDGVVRCPQPEGSVDVPSGSMFRPGFFNLMSHNFAIIDTRTIWNFARPFDETVGPLVGYRAESELMREVFVREFTQLHGGVFATTLDVYNGPVKSSPQNNPNFNAQSYLTDRGELVLRFNPQDRLTKTIIDDTYRARASVFIVTDNLAEDFLVDALAYKAAAARPGSDDPAFDVRVIVRSDAQSEFTRSALEATGVVRYAPADIERLPTIAIYDSLPDADGNNRPRQVHVASQPLWRAGPFDVTRPSPQHPICNGTVDCLVIHPADYFVDGNMWSLVEYRGQIHEVEEIDRLETFFNDLWASSEAP